MSKKTLPKYTELKEWSTVNVINWLEQNDFRECVNLFLKHNIDGVKLAAYTGSQVPNVPPKQARKLVKLVNEVEGSPHRSFTASFLGSLPRGSKYQKQTAHHTSHNDEDDDSFDESDSDEGYEDPPDAPPPGQFPGRAGHGTHTPSPVSNVGRRPPPPPPTYGSMDEPGPESNSDEGDDYLEPDTNVPQVPSRRPPPALPPQNHESSPPIARRSQPITPQHNNKVGPVQIDPYTLEIPSTDAIYFEPVELSEIEPWSPLPPPRPARPSRAGSTQHLSVGESKRGTPVNRPPAIPNHPTPPSNIIKSPLPPPPPEEEQDVYEEMDEQDDITDETYELPVDQMSGGSNCSIQDRPLPPVPALTAKSSTPQPQKSLPAIPKANTNPPPIPANQDTPLKEKPAIPKKTNSIIKNLMNKSTKDPPLTPQQSKLPDQKESPPWKTQKKTEIKNNNETDKTINSSDSKKKFNIETKIPGGFRKFANKTPEKETVKDTAAEEEGNAESGGKALSIAERIKQLNKSQTSEPRPPTGGAAQPTQSPVKLVSTNQNTKVGGGAPPRFGSAKNSPSKNNLPEVPSAAQVKAEPPVLPARRPDQQGQTENLYNFEWYHGQVNRTDCKKKLERMRSDGCFLIRKSERGGQEKPYTIQLWCGGRDYNIPIRRREKETYAIGVDIKRDDAGNDIDKIFKTLAELIHYHKTYEINLSGGDKCKLTRHVPK